MLTAVVSGGMYAQGATELRPLTWSDIPSGVRPLLAEHGFDEQSASTRLSAIRRSNQERVREGDRDHLVHYVLQSPTFTTLRPIEPAISARMLVEGLSDSEHTAFLKGVSVSDRVIPPAARARIEAFIAAVTDPSGVARMESVRPLLDSLPATTREALQRTLNDEYLRAMRFLYEKEFVAARSGTAVADTSRLYQTRGLSTEASVEAGYAVYLALATLRTLEPTRTIRRVLIVGPGLDVAPPTGFSAAVAVQSYQPFAVMDALVAIGLASIETLSVRAVDINPRVVAWLNDIRGARLRLRMTTAIVEAGGVHFTDDFRRYFNALGNAVGETGPPESPAVGRLAKTLDMASGVTQGIVADPLDVVVDRLPERFDLVVATNVFPYLSDEELVLAVTNIASMLAPAGVLIHNEPRPVAARTALALGLAPIHAGSTLIASVDGASTPLHDAIWMHRAP